MSSSLPEEVQLAFYRTIAGLQHVEIMRCAYAIEYDCVDPLQLDPTLEFQDLPGLYGAGQFNGSSGYEEAAAQGLLAGINAARHALGKQQVILDRAGSYLGTLVDDLVTKGVSDPYRMMTSRSEYRLVLRQDNADERLTPLGHELGLISDKRFAKFQEKQSLKEQEQKRAQQTVFSPTDELNQILVSRGTSPVTSGVHLIDLLRRPELNYAVLAPIDTGRPELPDAVLENVEIEIKYEGYIRRQKADIAEMRRLEKRLLPREINYKEITGLRLEAQEKLEKIRPASIGQASRISGVSPADLSVLLIWLARQEGKEETTA
jgi:tRNA uridine 5-carboxymethylaminomethyl modification enzyme